MKCTTFSFADACAFPHPPLSLAAIGREAESCSCLGEQTPDKIRSPHLPSLLRPRLGWGTRSLTLALWAVGRYIHHSPTQTPSVTSPSTQTGGLISTRPTMSRPVAETASSGRSQSRRTTSPVSATRKPRNMTAQRAASVLRSA